MGSALCCLEKPSSSWDQSLYEELKHAEGRSEIAASQLELAPLLFDLIKIEDYHPYVAKSEVVGKQTLGVGAKRKLTYRSGSFFYETVVFSDGVESIVFELSQHSFPCPRMFAKISTEKIDDDNSTFIVRLSFEISDDCPEAAAATFEKQIQMLVEQMAINAKAHMEASDKKTRDLDISFEESSVPPNAVSPRSLEEPHFNSRGSDYYKSDLIKVEGTSKIAANQLELAPLLFDLIKIQDYHPLLGKSVVVGNKTQGVGAKRKLTYKSGSFFFETVIESNGVDTIIFELTEYSFPCSKMYARMSTKRIDDENSTFSSTLAYKMMKGVPKDAAANFHKQIQGLAAGIALKAKAHAETTASLVDC